MDQIYYCHIDTLVGPFLIAGTDEALICTSFCSGKGQRQPEDDWKADKSPLGDAICQFSAYFEGENVQFDLKLNPTGTDFQKTVWKALCEIPYGETWSYGDVAKHIGNPGGSRAVGLANGANPLPVIVPCHRVIGANGKLTGFGGGMEAKLKLLQMEGAVPSHNSDQLSLL